MSRTTLDKERWQNAIAELRRVCRKGTTVYVINRSVARSGMSRRVSMFVVHKGRIRDVTGMVALVTGMPGDYERGMRVDGGGMDMHWHAVESLWLALGHQPSTWSHDAPLVKVSL